MEGVSVLLHYLSLVVDEHERVVRILLGVLLVLLSCRGDHCRLVYEHLQIDECEVDTIQDQL